VPATSPPDWAAVVLMVLQRIRRAPPLVRFTSNRSHRRFGSPLNCTLAIAVPLPIGAATGADWAGVSGFEQATVAAVTQREDRGREVATRLRELYPLERADSMPKIRVFQGA